MFTLLFLMMHEPHRMFVQQVLSSFTNILWPSVNADYGRFPRTSTALPFVLEDLQKEDHLYFSHTKVLGLLMAKCTKLVADLPALLGRGNGKTTHVHISAHLPDDRIEIGFRLFYVHLAHLVFLAFTPRVKGQYTKAYSKQMYDMLDGWLSPQSNGPLRSTMADSISQQFKVDLTFLGQLYMEYKCMLTPEYMPTWAELSTVILDQTLISSSPPIADEAQGRSYVQNPFFRTMAPNAAPGSLDCAAWSTLPQNWRVVILMLMVRTLITLITLSLNCNTKHKRVGQRLLPGCFAGFPKLTASIGAHH
jgi:hypothetical protein